MTTTAVLDELARGVLGSKLLFEQGFEYTRGTFHRELPGGLRHLITLDLNRAKGAFYVLLGVNAGVLSGTVPTDQGGAYHSCYLSPGGVVQKPAGFPATTSDTTAASLERVVACCREHALPWLQCYATLSAFADALPETHDFFKGRLLLADGQSQRAKKWLHRYRDRLLEMPASPDVAAAVRETDLLLQQCE